MVDSPKTRDSPSPSPREERLRSKSRSRSRSRSRPRYRSRSRSLPRPISPSRNRGRSRSRSRGRSEVENPGTTLYVTGLSTRVTDKDLEAHFSKEGKVASCFLVMEPRTHVSRGFAFVTMDSLKDAERCIKYLNQSVLEGRYITVERSRRKRPRTPTPGHYLGLKSSKENDREGRSSRGRHYDRDDYGHRRSPRRDYSPRDGKSSRRDRSYSPRRDYSPRDGRGPERSERRRDYSPRDRRSPERRYQPRGSR
ncbi:Serine/arginine-rich splicing factor SR45a [Cardamine amara subsp. amara]|uniref:Serine/arginine-rich splicing factor SR45a n=1 Tax=Cardamine amara subsp. amara TaxID=228776 RepID=A0ABD1B9X7_CARAN